MIHQTNVFTLSIAFSNSVIMKLNLFALSKHEQVYMIVLYWKNIDIVAGLYIFLTHTLDLNELWRKSLVVPDTRADCAVEQVCKC